MSKSATISAIPKLRFKLFESEGDWEYENGDQLFDSISDKNHKSDLPILAITQDQGAIPRDQIDYHVSVSEKGIENYKVVQIGDFIISLRSFQGGIEYSNYHGLCSPAYIILRRKKDGSDSFYKYYFKSTKFIQDLNKNLEGIRDGKMVSYKQFSEILIPNPSPAEQQKIADCLSSLDELIQAETERLEALQAHKKGLMQQLFPAEGETVPKLRFPEFQNSGEWVEKELGELIKIKSGLSPSQFNLKTIGLFPFIKVEDLNNCNKYQSQSREYCDEGEGRIPKNSVIFPKRGAAINMNKVRLNKVDIFVDTNIMALIPSEKIDSEFLYYIILNIGLYRIADSSTIPQINNKHIEPFKILTTTKNEQRKIVSFLLELDDFITSQSEKIESLKSHKKGLLQHLFPQLD